MSQEPRPLEDPALFAAEIERVRAGGILGRATLAQRLFEFLVECHATGRVPKELEVAVDGFGRGADFDVAQDATVRVTVHKLRRRLEEFYRSETSAAARLTLPRGEYRLLLESGPVPAEPAAVHGWRAWLPATRRERIGAALLVVFAALCAVLVVALARRPTVDEGVAAVRDSPLWSAVLSDRLPIQLVLGDYYIFGETKDGRVVRLVRDFDVNSPQDLERRFVSDPTLMARYADLHLGYLPTSSAQALREVLPVVMASGKHVTLTLASELDPSTIKSTHIVYIGYLSALGMLEDMVFAGSHYAIGASYDELIDTGNGHAWTSEAGEPHGNSERYRDYAYLASFSGPGDVRHLVIAGTRDTGLMQAAELAAQPAAMHELTQVSGTRRGVEALYEVQGVNGVNVESRLISANASGKTTAPP